MLYIRDDIPLKSLTEIKLNNEIENIFIEINLRWLVGLKLIQLEQQKTQLPFVILAENLKTIKIFELEINNLRIQILVAKMT